MPKALFLLILAMTAFAFAQAGKPSGTGGVTPIIETPDSGADNPVMPPRPARPIPFFTPWDTPFRVPPFEKIQPEHYLPPLRRA